MKKDKKEVLDTITNIESNFDESAMGHRLLGVDEIMEDLDVAMPEWICGIGDERRPVNSINTPYKMICRLIIHAKNGRQYVGSGFFISPRCIITSGHCVYLSTNRGISYDWAERIEVIPGGDGTNASFGRQFSRNFKTVKEWSDAKKKGFDIGAIILPDNTLFNNVKSFFSYEELENTDIQLYNSGYPSDKDGTQWLATSKLDSDSNQLLHYYLDTKGGNSGSPVFFMRNGTPIVVGVHGYGQCPNAAVKIRPEIVSTFELWKRS